MSKATGTIYTGHMKNNDVKENSTYQFCNSFNSTPEPGIFVLEPHIYSNFNYKFTPHHIDINKQIAYNNAIQQQVDNYEEMGFKPNVGDADFKPLLFTETSKRRVVNLTTVPPAPPRPSPIFSPVISSQYERSIQQEISKRAQRKQNSSPITPRHAKFNKKGKRYTNPPSETYESSVIPDSGMEQSPTRIKMLSSPDTPTNDSSSYKPSKSSSSPVSSPTPFSRSKKTDRTPPKIRTKKTDRDSLVDQAFDKLK